LIPRFQGENFNKNLEIVHKLNEFAEKKGVTSGQLCLAWILAQVNNLLINPENLLHFNIVAFFKI
jgi:aryl-alcohol dehydrogenase-like predicted oxidoreductase